MNAFPFTAFDLVVGVVLLISVAAAISRGFVRELLSLASWGGALVAAFYAFPHVRPLVFDAVGNDLVADLATAVGSFLVPWIVLRLLAGAIGAKVSQSAFAGADRMLALVYGAARGAFVVCAAYLAGLILLDDAPMPRWIAGAWSRPFVEDGARSLGRLLPPGFLREAEKGVRRAAERVGEAGGGYREDANRALEQLIRRVE